jgi:CheY-like chemotaxis protein
MSRVLLVDDNVAAVQAAALLLEQWGHEVRVAADGPAAILAARKWHPNVVLLDIGLPGMDGFEVAGILRRDPALRGCRIIAMSALYREGDDARLAAAHLDQLIRKPLDLVFLRSFLGNPAGTVGRHP